MKKAWGDVFKRKESHLMHLDNLTPQNSHPSNKGLF